MSWLFAMYAYELDFDVLVDSLAKSLRNCNDRSGWLVPFENILIGAGIDISDSGDSRRCSAAMQDLRRRGLARFSRRYRAWVASDKLLGK